MMRIEDIFQYLPHRYPFLLIDRVTELKEMEYLKGYKNITFNEPQFTGHFPDHPIMPGVMIIEAMAQATGILAFKSSASKPSENDIYFHVQVISTKRGVWKFNAETHVDGKLIASAELMCAEREVV
ncbi:MAG TPA: 3-hydroxyacyl-ACP dehydratase FabZ [Thiotrichales bacterium]|nr:3-hydroxyacyl-ACP dehydratase FabZ [Thiotrichales bacterium]